MKSATSTLKRMDVASSALTDKITTLAAQAKLVLGYAKLADRVLSPVRLASVLKDLEIQPFSDASVKEYQAAKIVETRELRKAEAKKSRTPSWQRSQFRERILWKSFDIARYTKTVPEFALRKGIQVKSACPDARILIEELTVQRTQPVRKDYDPFLVVALGSERYYIEVWDEAKFETKLY